MSKPAKIVDGKIKMPDPAEDIKTWSPTGRLRYKEVDISGKRSWLLQQEFSSWPGGDIEWRRIPIVPLEEDS